MEERIIDDPRKISVKKTAAGGIQDATDALAPEGETVGEEDIELELPPEEFEDEDLIGLAPSELKKALEKREKEAAEARAERDRLIAEGDRAFEAGDFGEAEPFYAQALVYDEENVSAQEKIWACRTHGFCEAELMLNRKSASEFADAPEEVRGYVLGKIGETFEEARRAAEEEAAPLREKVGAAQKERREAFAANRNYYRTPFLVFTAVLLGLVLAAGVSAVFIVRTQSIAPLVLTLVFAGLAVADLIPFFLSMRRLVVAERLVRTNEKLSSTGDGARLAGLEERLECLAMILG